MLAVVLPLHFFFNKESRNHLDWLSCLDIGNVPRDTWLQKVGFWFKCAEYYVVILLINRIFGKVHGKSVQNA